MAIARYQKKISGPLLDRIDIHVEVPRVDYEKLADKRQVEDSKTIRVRVQAARERQLERFKGTKLTCNAEMGPTEVGISARRTHQGRSCSRLQYSSYTCRPGRIIVC
jgi:magnesium chelatase family protein